MHPEASRHLAETPVDAEAYEKAAPVSSPTTTEEGRPGIASGAPSWGMGGSWDELRGRMRCFGAGMRRRLTLISNRVRGQPCRVASETTGSLSRGNHPGQSRYTAPGYSSNINRHAFASQVIGRMLVSAVRTSASFLPQRSAPSYLVQVCR